jgi:hypothetical protein
MKWILFTGTWRLTNAEVEKDVREAVREVVARGDGVLTGGATGVDFFAKDEALKQNPDATRIKIIIPAFLEDYIHDVHTNWCTPPITKEYVDRLAELLRKIKEIRPESIIEMPNKIITQHHYDLRNIEEVKVADGVFAFQVNKSSGTQQTIDEANLVGVPILLHKEYAILE